MKDSANRAHLAQTTNKFNWDTLIVVAIFHVLAIVALFYFSWQNLAGGKFGSRRRISPPAHAPEFQSPQMA